MGQRCRLKSKSVSPKVARTVGAAATEAEGLKHAPRVQASTIVGNIDGGGLTSELDFDSHIGRAGGDTVVYKVGNRADEIVPNVPQRRCEPSGRWRGIGKFHRFKAPGSVLTLALS
nr:hypothetical protein MFLOJ_58880 [Mycobacterium florentinum]